MSMNSINDPVHWSFVKRTADKDVSSNITVADDGVLGFAVLANETYRFEAVIIYSSPVGGGTPDLKFRFLNSTGTINTAQMSFAYHNASDAITALDIHTSTQTTAGTHVRKRVIQITGFINIDTNANFNFQWSQGISDANATRVHSGSFLKWSKV